MSEHVGYVVKVQYLRPHSNADRLQVATFFGNDTIVDLSVKEGDIGIYFPVDLQLSEEYCDQNHLCRKKADGTSDTGYLDRKTRHVTAIKLRKEKSDGLYMPLSSLDYCGGPPLELGDKIDTYNQHEICKKYIPNRQYAQGSPSNGNRTRKRHVLIAPLFAEHADTEQLAYNMNAFKYGDLIEITLKMHGTSQRTGYLPKYQGEKKTLWQKIFNKPGTPIYSWGYVTGTRRTVLNDFDGGYYGSNVFRAPHAKFFEGKLHKGETVYYEVVGFTTSGAPIMGEQANSKVDKLLGDKSFSKTYGNITTFSYGCTPSGQKEIFNENGHTAYEQVPQSDFYVYRMTMTNEDGDVVEYTPDFMRYRCEQMGCKSVPVLWQGYLLGSSPLPPGERIKATAEQFYDGPDPIGKTHVREGVVIRIVNRPKFCAYKHKNFSFKVLEGLIKENASAPDIEEAEEIKNEGDIE